MATLGRREFVIQLAAATGGIVLVPSLVSCADNEVTPETPVEPDKPEDAGVPEAPSPDLAAIPLEKSKDWDVVAFNEERGNAGASPEAYRDDINGPDGIPKHLGKHLPYVPEMDAAAIPAGFLALMWGDPKLDYVRHPNAPKGTPNYENGHWYDWVKVRKATAGEALESTSTFSNWPTPGESNTGKYAAFEGEDISADGGKNTVYLVALPTDVKSGDVVRIHAHCLYHGEYVDFVTVP